jgi:hypothetical protein
MVEIAAAVEIVLNMPILSKSRRNGAGATSAAANGALVIIG